MMPNYLVFLKLHRNAFRFVNVITSPKDIYGFSQTIKLPYNASIHSNTPLDSPLPWHSPPLPMTSIHSKLRSQYNGFLAIQMYLKMSLPISWQKSPLLKNHLS